MSYSDNAISVYKKLYFTKDETNPLQTHDRVANAIADTPEFKQEITQALDEKAIRPNSPVLINAGSPTPQYAACFVGNLEDSLSSIFEANKEAGLIYSKGSGLGLNYGMLREKGAELSSDGQSSGACSFLYMLAATAECVKSGGRARRCLPLNTKVSTDKGLVNIQDIKIGNLVKTSCGYYPVLNVFEQGIQKTMIFETNLGNFECTPNHKTAIYDKDSSNKYKFILAKEITLTDKLMRMTSEDVFLTADINTIKTGRMIKTYDLEVDEVHEFIADGFLTHNSAHMAMFTDNHPDIEEFITIKNGKDQRLRSMNLSIATTDEFMQAVKDDKDWNLIGVKDKQIKKTLKARELFDKIIDNAYNTGDPALWFSSRVNEDNPFYPDKTINCTNPSLRKGTRVLTNLGYLPIEELENKEFQVYNLNGKLSPAKCFLSGRNKRLYKITLSGNLSYYATAEHKWAIKDKDNDKYIKKTTLELEKGMSIPYNKPKIRLNFGYQGDFKNGFQDANKYKFDNDIWDIKSDDYRQGYINGIFNSMKWHQEKERFILSDMYPNINNIIELLGIYGFNINYSNNLYEILPNQRHFITNFLKLIQWNDIDNYPSFMNTYSISNIQETDLYEDVWDISVYDDTHCFELGNCVTGNCGK